MNHVAALNRITEAHTLNGQVDWTAVNQAYQTLVDREINNSVVHRQELNPFHGLYRPVPQEQLNAAGE